MARLLSSFLARVAPGLAVAGAAAWVLWRHRQLAAERDRTRQDRLHTGVELAGLDRRLAALTDSDRRLASAADASELAAIAVQIPGELVPLLGAALVRYDNPAAPLAIEYRGTISTGASEALREVVASPRVLERCQTCHLRPGEHRVLPGRTCALVRTLHVPDAGFVMCLPVERHGHAYGALGIFLAGEHTLADAEHALLRGFVDKLALAFEALRLREHDLAALCEVGAELRRQQGFEHMANHILERTMHACGAEAAALLVPGEPDAERPEVLAALGDWTAATVPPVVLAMATGARGHGDRLRELTGGNEPAARAVLVVPLMATGGPAGALALGSRRHGAFQDAQRQLAGALAAQLGLLVSNARLYGQIECQTTLTERRRVARRLSAGPLRRLAGLRRRLEHDLPVMPGPGGAAARQDLLEGVEKAYRELRVILDLLRREPVMPGDLASALRQMAADAERESGLLVELVLDAEPEMASPARAHLLRIAHESLQNASTHAHAEHVWISVGRAGANYRLEVRDDGRGFDVSRDVAAPRLGLHIMRERADLLGARLQICSAAGAGTAVTVDWPVEITSPPTGGARRDV